MSPCGMPILVVFLKIFTISGFTLSLFPPLHLPAFFSPVLVPHSSARLTFLWYSLVQHSSGIPSLSLPISFLLSSLTITWVAFSQFGASSFTRISYTVNIPNISFLLFLFTFFTDSYYIFPIWCHLFHSCHVDRVPNSHFSSCQSLHFSFSIFHRSLHLPPHFRTVSNRSAFPSKYVANLFPP